MTRRRRRHPQQQWHRFLAKGFELSVGQTGVQVFAEVEVTQNPPKVDILLLRRTSDRWTPEQLALLPDGIRDCDAGHVLIEFKYTESLTVDALRQAVSYEYFYRTANDLKPEAVKMFVLCAKTPNPERLQNFGYEESHLAGVHVSSHELTGHIPLLALNDLSDAPHNAFVKAFASRPAQKAKALATIRTQSNLSDALVTYFDVLGAIWSLPEGVIMDEILTPERVLEIGQEWKRILLQHTSPDQLNELLSPEYKQQLINQGIERGIERGTEQKSRDIVLAMAAKGFDLAVIADITGLTVTQVQALLQEKTTTSTTPSAHE
ncbi:MAG: hypothetical protein R3C14_22565 [Caldilineaceae bacterium]